ncbi:MAG TPA: ankyrin repeat domain-containing protein [Chthoniobacterales bacterium]
MAVLGLVVLVSKMRQPAKQSHFSILAPLDVATSHQPPKPNLNLRDDAGRTPLLIATQQGDTAAVTRLLEDGADVDIPEREGITPIMIAAQNGEIDLLRELVAHSKCLDAADAAGRTALQYAIAAAQTHTVDLLLSAMPDRNVTTDLLALACGSGNPEMVRVLLAHAPAGLNWNPETRAALKLAFESKDLDLLRLVLSKHAAQPTVEGGATPLLAEAIVSDKAELFNALLAAGADPNTTLPLPAEKPFVSLIKSEDLRGYVRSDEGMTVLMLAAGIGKTEYVRALLDAGAERNRATKKFKMLALYFAAHNGKSKCIQTLLGHGPTPDELRIEVSLATQRASVIKGGKPILQTAISTGRDGYATQTGEYVITDKDKNHRSSIYKVEMPFFMRLNCRDFGLHAGVVRRSPSSHGCIRLPADIAEKLFSEIPVGTVVTIN